MSMTTNLINDAIRDAQHATGAIRRLTVLAAMGAIPERHHYQQLHATLTQLNLAAKQLIKALQAQDAYRESDA